MFNVYLSLVCRTGDLVLIAPRFLALGCQLPVLHHHSKIHRYQTTSPSLGGSPGPGSGRPQSQRLQTTLSQRRLQSLTEANLRQTRNRCVLQKLSPASEATPVSESFLSGMRQRHDTVADELQRTARLANTPGPDRSCHMAT